MCSDDREYSKLLCEACRRCDRGDLDKVKELVEQHKVNPNGEDVHCTISSDQFRKLMSDCESIGHA